jgi:APA family basic amino acid/polyamine antiporter
VTHNDKASTITKVSDGIAFSAANAATAPPALPKELTLFDAVSLVVGTIIGTGIFIIPSSIAVRLNSLGAVLLVWVVGGILTLFGALALGELGSIYPGTGGLCTYLHHAYGPLWAFLYAWALLSMIHSGSIAALGVAFGIYAGQVFPLSPVEQKCLRVAGILVLTGVSCLGIRRGKFVQNLIAVTKVLGLVGIIVVLAVKGSRPLHLFAFGNGGSVEGFSFAGFGVALVAVLWAYEGWHVVSFVAGEMRRPQANLPRSLFLGTALVLLVFTLANLGYYHVLSAAEIRGSGAVAASAVGAVVGQSGRIAISLLVVVSTLGSMNGMILTGPRVYYALACDKLFPTMFGRVNERYRTPMVALLVQGVWASVLAASGSYEQLFTDVIFTAWIFYGMAVAAVLVLRYERPEVLRPFRVPGYPWVPLAFSIAAAGLVASTVVERPTGALLGIGVVAVGAPVYLFRKRLRADQDLEIQA